MASPAFLALLLLTCLLLAPNNTGAQKGQSNPNIIAKQTIGCPRRSKRLPPADKASNTPRFKACKRNQPAAKLNECVKDSLQKAVPELVKGLPNLGLTTIDPLRVGSLEVPPNKKKNAVSVEVSFKNLDIIGLRNAKIKNANMDVEKMKMRAKIDVDGPIILQGDYKITGKVLVLPIQGSGRCNITIVNPKGEITELLAKPIKKDGKTFAKVTSLKFINDESDRVYYQLDNLFNGNKELGENMNLVLNDNWKQIFEDMRGPVEAALSGAFRSIVEKLVDTVPYDEIFP